MVEYITVSSEVTSLFPQMALGLISYSSANNRVTHPALAQELEQLADMLRSLYDRERLLDYPGVRACRDAFRSLRIDPTRYRPSSEALVRRILQGNPLPLVNSAVDLNNYWSVYYGVPFGLYDQSALSGDVVFRVGDVEDSYSGLNGRLMSMDGKPLLADNVGAFGSPIVDSVRTQVTAATTEMLQVVFLFPNDHVKPKELIGNVAASFVRWTGATVTDKRIVKTSQQ